MVSYQSDSFKIELRKKKQLERSESSAIFESLYRQAEMGMSDRLSSTTKRSHRTSKCRTRNLPMKDRETIFEHDQEKNFRSGSQTSHRSLSSRTKADAHSRQPTVSTPFVHTCFTTSHSSHNATNGRDSRQEAHPRALEVTRNQARVH